MNTNIPLAPVPRNEWMVVYSTYDLSDAHVVAGRLEVDGIRAFIHRQAGAALGVQRQLGEVGCFGHAAPYQTGAPLAQPDDSLINCRIVLMM